MEKKDKYGNIFDTPIITLDLSNRAFNSLNKNGIVTLGDLAMLKSLWHLKGLGEKSGAEIMNKINSLMIPGFHFGMTEIDIICYGMSGEEREAHVKEYKRIIEQERSWECNRNKLLNMYLSDLEISDPIVISTDSSTTKKTIIIQRCKLKDLILNNHISGYLQSYENINELIEGIKRLNIPGLYIGMSSKELYELCVSDVMMEYISEVVRNERLKREIFSCENARALREQNQLLLNRLISETRDGITNIESQNKELKARLKILKDLIAKKNNLEEENRRLNCEIAFLMNQLSENTTLNGGGSHAK